MCLWSFQIFLQSWAILQCSIAVFLFLSTQETRLVCASYLLILINIDWFGFSHFSPFLLCNSKVHQWIWIFSFIDLLLHKLKWLFPRAWTAWKTWRTWRTGSVRRTCRWSSPWMARTWRPPWPPPRQPYFDHTQDNYILIKDDLDLKQPPICIFIPHKAMWFGELFRINCVEQIFVVFGTWAPINCCVLLWKS